MGYLVMSEGSESPPDSLCGEHGEFIIVVVDYYMSVVVDTKLANILFKL
jgi:hypothetical protein